MKKVKFDQEIYTFHIDFAGHVSNIVYVQWMEIGRLKLLAEAGLPVEKIIRDFGLLPTLIETKIRYKQQLFLGDQVQIEVWLSRLKNVSAVMEFSFCNQHRQLVAQGSQTGLFIDAGTHRPAPLPKSAHQMFLPFVRGDEGL